MSKKATRKRGIVEIGDSLNWEGRTPASFRGRKVKKDELPFEFRLRVNFIYNDLRRGERPPREHTLKLGGGWSADNVAGAHHASWPIKTGDYRAILGGNKVKFVIPHREAIAVHRIMGGNHPNGVVIPCNGTKIKVLNDLWVWVSSSPR